MLFNFSVLIFPTTTVLSELESGIYFINVLKEPKPFILQKSLDDYYVNYELNVSIEDPKLMNKTYSDLHKHLLEEFNAAEVEILSPQYVVERHDNTSTIYKEDKNIIDKVLDKLKGQD